MIEKINSAMIQTIFGSPVVFLNIDNVEEVFSKDTYNCTVEYLTDPNNHFFDHPLSRGGSICTTAEYLNSKMWLNTLNESPRLLEYLKSKALKYAHYFSDTAVNDLEFHSSWVNLMFQGCEISSHIDKSDTSEKTLIVLFYPKAPIGGSNLVFIHNTKEGNWVSDCREENLVRTIIEEGSIVIFDNFMFHAVDTHGVNEPRMSVSIEFKFVK